MELESVVDFPVSVVLPASGNGERFGGSVPKQYCPVLKKPLILFTLKAFHRYQILLYATATFVSDFFASFK